MVALPLEAARREHFAQSFIGTKHFIVSTSKKYMLLNDGSYSVIWYFSRKTLRKLQFMLFQHLAFLKPIDRILLAVTSCKSRPCRGKEMPGQGWRRKHLVKASPEVHPINSRMAQLLGYCLPAFPVQFIACSALDRSNQSIKHLFLPMPANMFTCNALKCLFSCCMLLCI